MIQWMDYSGAPAIIVPRSLLGAWTGFFMPLAEADYEDFPDLELADGRQFNMYTEFDFTHPVTAYDHLCAAFGRRECMLHPVEGGSVLAISNGLDIHGWWPEARTVVTGGNQLPPIEALESVDWEDVLEWVVSDPRLVLMNACLHGAQIDMGEAEGEYAGIDLPVGTYRVMYGEIEGLWLYRFRL